MVAAQPECSRVDVIVGHDANGSVVWTCATCGLPIYEQPLEQHACFQPPTDEDDA